MGLNPKVWSGSPRGVVLGVAMFVAVAAVLVVTVVSGTSDDPPDQPSVATSETSAGSPAPESSAATVPPDSKPSSGSTEVPEPGSLETVKVEEVSYAPPVGLDETADFGTGLTLRLTEIEAVEGVARGPGQVSGPALRLVVKARNASKAPVSLEGMVVALAYGAAGTPATSLSEPGGKPFEGELPARGEAVAVYVFAVAEESRDRVTVSASYTGSAPTVVFEGAADRMSR
jgi:hypothetical protein